ncbi:MAG: hypothetical protein J3K34DRAFT_409090 [Monoraphidium minutum]|nr:MAG: hypothetical protein J3K34DRAFT_409090 [Monoraphidium minutum]
MQSRTGFYRDRRPSYAKALRQAHWPPLQELKLCCLGLPELQALARLRLPRLHSLELESAFGLKADHDAGHDYVGVDYNDEEDNSDDEDSGDDDDEEEGVARRPLLGLQLLVRAPWFSQLAFLAIRTSQFPADPGDLLGCQAPNLRALEIDWCSFGQEGAARLTQLQLPKLTALSITGRHLSKSGPFTMQSEGIAALLRGWALEQLDTLCLRKLPIYHALTEALAGARLPKLRVLTIADTDFDVPSLTYIAEATWASQLRELNLSLGSVDQDGRYDDQTPAWRFFAAAPLNKLESLRLSGRRGTLPLLVLQRLSNAAWFRHLHHLALPRLPELTYDRLRKDAPVLVELVEAGKGGARDWWAPRAVD